MSFCAISFSASARRFSIAGEIVAFSLNERGGKIWSDIVMNNADRKTGLFVRGGLVSLTTVKAGGTGSTIYISGIPSFTLARIFSEDIVVGTYAKFMKVK